VEDASGFAMGDELQVDLDSSTIHNVTKGESTYFEMKTEDRNTFQQGGMIGRVRRHLEEILQLSAT
jgi:3-isopropylmalate dehydratase small subunit